MNAPSLRLVRDVPDGTLPPFDIDAEAAVLSSVILDPAAMSKVDGFLRPEHFYGEAHKRMFEACVALKADGRPIDAVTVSTWLRDRDRILQVGGIAYVLEVVNTAPAVANVTAYAATIYEKWRARRVILVCQQTAARGYTDYGDTQSFADEATTLLAAIARQSIASKNETNLEALKRIVRGIASGGAVSADRGVTGIPTGLPAYDKLTQGLHAGQKTTVVALSGRGKTAFGLQVAVNVALQGIGVLFFSQEMKRDELLLRILAMLSNIDSNKLKAATLSQSEFNRLYETAPRVARLPLTIDDQHDLHIEQIRGRTLAHVDAPLTDENPPLGLVVVDYIQRLRAAPAVERCQRHEQIAHATKGFKLLCQELSIPGIELAQQKPAEPDARTKIRPKPATGCVADSSQIEKEADNVIYLHRQPSQSGAHELAHYGRAVGEDPRSILLILDKQRGGDTGEIPMRFEREYSRFVCQEEGVYR